MTTHLQLVVDNSDSFPKNECSSSLPSLSDEKIDWAGVDFVQSARRMDLRRRFEVNAEVNAFLRSFFSQNDETFSLAEFTGDAKPHNAPAP